MMKIAGKIVYGLFIALLVGIAGLFLASLLPIPGNIEVKIVKSGSMEPTIMTGAITVVRPADSYAVGDIVMFGEDTREAVPTTHRIIAASVEGGQTVFTTKGDANEEEDPQPVYESDVIGKVVFSAPYAGFVLDFARTPVGFALLVGVPALMIIVDEIGKIIAEVKRMRMRAKGGDGEDEDEEDEDENEEEGDGEPEEEMKKAAPRREARQESLVQRTLPRSLVSVDGIIPASALADYYGVRLVATKRSRGAVHFSVRTLAMAFIIAGSCAGILTVGGTSSKYADEEASIGNRFRALWVDLSLSAGEEPAARMMSFASDEGEDPIDVGETHFDITLGEESGSSPLVYSIEAALAGGPEACGDLALEARLGEEEWSGLFKDFSRPTTDELGTWSFAISVPGESALGPDALCEGSLIFRAYPKGEDGALSRIFSDEEEYRFALQNYPASIPEILGTSIQNEELIEPKGSAEEGGGGSGGGEEKPKEEPVIPEEPKGEEATEPPPAPEPIIEGGKSAEAPEIIENEEEPAEPIAEEEKEDPIVEEESAEEKPAPEPEEASNPPPASPIE